LFLFRYILWLINLLFIAPSICVVNVTDDVGFKWLSSYLRCRRTLYYFWLLIFQSNAASNLLPQSRLLSGVVLHHNDCTSCRNVNVVHAFVYLCLEFHCEFILCNSIN
jgi:hypothetical protein